MYNAFKPGTRGKVAATERGVWECRARGGHPNQYYYFLYERLRWSLKTVHSHPSLPVTMAQAVSVGVAIPRRTTVSPGIVFLTRQYTMYLYLCSVDLSSTDLSLTARCKSTGRVLNDQIAFLLHSYSPQDEQGERRKAVTVNPVKMYIKLQRKFS
ncbi:hypothetical protein BT96DRAFT_948802 [Gymnopus androsaceus JB14]|uniref:Uncharacterized protein n=1 Tax=Gymnopus androsaceus JB14 TaxID=1447944 RepID=A0A6A4GMC3_9AGAR|nr:hypothetical protein BT96DRAFT_948802 [Gymnopus androsaceus JB14]